MIFYDSFLVVNLVNGKSICNFWWVFSNAHSAYKFKAVVMIDNLLWNVHLSYVKNVISAFSISAQTILELHQWRKKKIEYCSETPLFSFTKGDWI